LAKLGILAIKSPKNGIHSDRHTAAPHTRQEPDRGQLYRIQKLGVHLFGREIG